MTLFIVLLVVGVVFAMAAILTLGPLPSSNARDNGDWYDPTDSGWSFFGSSSSDDSGSFFDGGSD